MGETRMSASTLRIVTILLLFYAVGLIAFFIVNGTGGREGVGAMGAFMLATLGFVIVVSVLGLRPPKPATRAPRRLMLNIASLSAAGVAILALFGPMMDILLIALPMFALSASLHFYDRRTAFPAGGTI